MAMTPNQYCENKVRQSGSSFYYSFLFLAPEQRTAIMALYAFCREVDDIVDECSEPEIAQNKLNWWKQEIFTTFDPNAKQKPNHPVCQALQPLLEQYPFKMQYFLDIIQGMEMDLYHQGFQTFKELETYCYHAAGAVGLLTIEIMGYQNPATEQYAKNLGIALQLTNILRDVKEDLARSRLYLPKEDLETFGVRLEMLKTEQYSPEVLQLLAHQAERAETYYTDAMTNLPEPDRYQQRTGLIMAAIYHAILKKIVRKSYPVLTQRVNINPIQKLWIAWRTARKEYQRSLQQTP